MTVSDTSASRSGDDPAAKGHPFVDLLAAVMERLGRITEAITGDSKRRRNLDYFTWVSALSITAGH